MASNRRTVSSSDSPLLSELAALENTTTLAPRRCAAISNDVRVRVESSMNARTTVRPASVVRLGSPLASHSRSRAEATSNSSNSSRVIPSSASRWRPSEATSSSRSAAARLMTASRVAASANAAGPPGTEKIPAPVGVGAGWVSDLDMAPTSWRTLWTALRVEFWHEPARNVGDMPFGINSLDGGALTGAARTGGGREWLGCDFWQPINASGSVASSCCGP